MFEMRMCFQLQLREELIMTLEIRNGDMLKSVLVRSEDFLRTSRGQEALHVLDLAFPPSRLDDYRCVLDLLYAELTGWGRREALAYYDDRGPRLIQMYKMEEIDVWDVLVLRFLKHLQSLYEDFLQQGWKTGKRPRKLMSEVRGTLAVFKPRMPKFEKIRVVEEAVA
jgi:hypothetical protein